MSQSLKNLILNSTLFENSPTFTFLKSLQTFFFQENVLFFHKFNLRLKFLKLKNTTNYFPFLKKIFPSISPKQQYWFVNDMGSQHQQANKLKKIFPGA